MEAQGQCADPQELRRLLDDNRPASVLRLLHVDVPLELLVYKAAALIELDCCQDALELIESVSSNLESSRQIYAWCLQAQILIRSGWYDSAILLATQAAKSTQIVDLRAEAFALVATGYAAKRCWHISEQNLHEALALAPTYPKVLAAQARFYLEADRRIEARRTYENMEMLPSRWAKEHSAWGRSYIAYLMGEFDRANSLAGFALEQISEVISPLYILAQVALADNDLPRLEKILEEIKRRSPQADGLPWYLAERERLHKRLAPTNVESRRRLASFPTIIQQRNYCGPSTVELVLRYWNGKSVISADQIAEKITYSHSGTPVYRMREFFNLVGFDTIRCQAPVEKLHRIIDAGFPIVVQEEYSSSSHVAVVIGYDKVEETIELQDPMTHIVTTSTIDTLKKLRHIYLDSALIAYPRGRGLDKKLSQLELFEDQAFVWTDQAILEIENGRYQASSALLNQAILRKPDLSLSWILLLHTCLEEWQRALIVGSPSELCEEQIGELREKYYEVLQKARQQMPDAEFIHQFAGRGAIIEHDYKYGIECFHKACEIDSEDARNYASLAECYFGLRDYHAALDAATEGLQWDSSLPAVNIWMARSLAMLGEENAFHYAQSAVDLDRENWLSHLALAEASLAQDNITMARQSGNLAISLAPSHPEAHLFLCIIWVIDGVFLQAEQYILDLLEKQQNLSPFMIFRAYQSLGNLYFNSGKFQKAKIVANHLLDLFPNDPWALKFLASTCCEELIKIDKPLNLEQLFSIVGLYEVAIRANHGNPWTIRNFITYLEILTDGYTVLETLKKLRREYPQNPSLYFLFGQILYQLGNEVEAANNMLKAIESDNGLQTREETLDAVKIVLSTMGIMKGTKTIMALPKNQGISSFERQRTLGIVLASLPELGANQAYNLLQQVHKMDPNDVEIILALGHVAQFENEREDLYRKALMMSSSWWPARYNLTNFLIERNRAIEALDFTRGYEHESSEMMLAHARALLDSGYYEEAMKIFKSLTNNAELPNPLLFKWLWQSESRSGKHTQALKTARRGRDLFPAEPTWYLHIAESLCTLNRFEEAIRVVKSGVLKGISEVEALKIECKVALSQEDSGNALVLLESLSSFQAQPKDGHLSWAEAQRFRLLIQIGQNEEALQLIRKASLTVNGLGEAAREAFLANNPSNAFELANEVLSSDPNNYYGLSVTAQILSDEGKINMAKQAWAELRDAYPNQHDPYEKLAMLMVLEGHPEQATAPADQAVHLGPFCTEAWATRGLVSFLNDHIEDALQDLNIAWNRMDSHQRNKFPEYGYLLAFINQNEDEMRLAWEVWIAQDLTPLRQKILQVLQRRIGV